MLRNVKWIIVISVLAITFVANATAGEVEVLHWWTSGGEAAAAEEQTEFTVSITSPGDKKLQVIKEVRALTSLGLKEAKDLVEAGGKAVKEAVSKDEAASIKEKIEAAGGQVDIQ